MSTDKISPARPLPWDSVDSWDVETDVAIIGFGGAGACAAIEASDAGAEVAIFEVASASGGSTALSSSEIYIGGNGGSPAQQANGFADDTEDLFRYLMMASGPNADESKVRLYAENSISHMEWLQDMGMEFNTTFIPEKTIIHLSDDCLLYTGSEEAWPFREQAAPCPRGHKPKIEGDNGGTYLMETLTAQVAKRNIRTEYNTRVLTLIQDQEGRVRGLVVNMNMKKCYVKARRGVILCAGGFAMNHEMVRKYAPHLLRNGNQYAIGNPYDDGAGIRMGMGAGGAAINMGEGFVSLPFYPPAQFVKGILVNAQGQRFINEDCYHGRVGHFCLRQRDDAIYLVVDNELYEKPNEYINMQLAGTGETIAELEQEVGLPKDSLQSTLKVFNQHAENKEDPLFHKHGKYLKPLNTPPYAAFDCSIGSVYYPYFTLGGLDTRTDGQVLDSDGGAIPGLFAAGRNTCGLPRTGAGYSSGMSVADVTFFGRLAGRTAAAET